MKCFEIMLRYDRGKVTIQTTADTAEAAVEIVLRAERAPRSAVLQVRQVLYDGSRVFVSY